MGLEGATIAFQTIGSAKQVKRFRNDGDPAVSQADQMIGRLEACSHIVDHDTVYRRPKRTAIQVNQRAISNKRWNALNLRTCGQTRDKQNAIGHHPAKSLNIISLTLPVFS